MPCGTPLLGVGLELDLGRYLGALGGVEVRSHEPPWAFGLRSSLAGPETFCEREGRREPIQEPPRL